MCLAAGRVALADDLRQGAAAASVAIAQAPRIEVVRGGVEIRRALTAEWRKAEAGERLAGGDAVRTGPDGRAGLLLGATRVRLYEDTRIELPTGGTAAIGFEAAEIARGSALVDLSREAVGRFRLRTPEMEARVDGMRIAVSVFDGLACVTVYRGEVGIRSRSPDFPHEMVVGEGFAAFGGGGRPFELQLSAAHDVWRGWAEGGAPPRLPHDARELLAAPAEAAPAGEDPPPAADAP